MEDLTSYDSASTPLTHEEMEDLKLSYITTREELNEAEQSNILRAGSWAFKRTRSVLDESFLKNLHKKMFCDVWKWAGKYRKTARNIGVDAYKISTDLNSLILDVKFWLDNRTFSISEIAVRLHHKLVFIHPFPNGNGRFGRLATDLFLKSQGEEEFTWGTHLKSPSLRRKTYVESLRSADKHDIEPLMAFVLSKEINNEKEKQNEIP